MLDALLPLVCAGCGGRTEHGVPLCWECRIAVRPAPSAPPPPGVDGWAAAFAYQGVARELVARLKYRNVRAAVPWIAAVMAAAVGAEAPVVDLVTWAPTTAPRRRARGFDPAELLARAVARHLRTGPVGLLRRLPGPPQTGLAAAARRAGPGFEPHRRAPPSVLVVDDVATTGATLAAAAAALRAAGARQVFAVTAARTPPPGGSQDRAAPPAGVIS